MSVYELAKKYYPKLWDEQRLAALVSAGKLTAEQYAEITDEQYEQHVGEDYA